MRNDVLNLVKDGNAIVKVLDQDDSKWNFSIDQINDPANVRPTELTEKGLHTPARYNPRTKALYNYTAKPHQEHRHTKKTSLTMIPTTGKIKLFSGDNNPLKFGFLFDANKCDLKEGKYAFTADAVTANRWWIGDTDDEYDNNNRNQFPSLGIEGLKAHIEKQAQGGRTQNYNEVLGGVNAEALKAVFFQLPLGRPKRNSNEYYQKMFEVIRKMEAVKTYTGLNLPILEIDAKRGFKEYALAEQIADLKEYQKRFGINAEITHLLNHLKLSYHIENIVKDCHKLATQKQDEVLRGHASALSFKLMAFSILNDNTGTLDDLESTYKEALTNISNYLTEKYLTDPAALRLQEKIAKQAQTEVASIDVSLRVVKESLKSQAAQMSGFKPELLDVRQSYLTQSEFSTRQKYQLAKVISPSLDICFSQKDMSYGALAKISAAYYFGQGRKLSYVASVYTGGDAGIGLKTSAILNPFNYLLAGARFAKLVAYKHLDGDLVELERKKQIGDRVFNFLISPLNVLKTVVQPIATVAAVAIAPVIAVDKTVKSGAMAVGMGIGSGINKLFTSTHESTPSSKTDSTANLESTRLLQPQEIINGYNAMNTANTDDRTASSLEHFTVQLTKIISPRLKLFAPVNDEDATLTKSIRTVLEQIEYDKNGQQDDSIILQTAVTSLERLFTDDSTKDNKMLRKLRSLMTEVSQHLKAASEHEHHSNIPTPRLA
jgi:hypothetical protein